MVIFAPTAGLIGTIKVTGAIAIVRIPIYARLVRGSVLSIKEKEYIEACRALGVRDPWILLRHVLPNCLAPIIVTTTLGIATSRKSTRLNSSHVSTSYAVFCLKKKTKP